MILTRIDEARHMARFYRLDITQDLFGGARLVRQWGRIGANGWQEKCEHFADSRQAQDRLDGLAAAKQRRGYLAARS